MDLSKHFTQISSWLTSNLNSLKHWMRLRRELLAHTVYSLQCRLVTVSRGWRRRFSLSIILRVAPNRNVLATSYNQDLAKLSEGKRATMRVEPIIGQSFPDFLMSEESKAVDDWRTTFGGSYYATGMGGSTTGRAATLLLIDDPAVKAREEADSATQRNKTWSYYVSALTIRKQPGTRRNATNRNSYPNSLASGRLIGRIMETEDWKEGAWAYVDFPAIRRVDTSVKRSVAELPEEDPRFIPQGELSKVSPSKRHYLETREEALWPERFPLEELKNVSASTQESSHPLPTISVHPRRQPN